MWSRSSPSSDSAAAAISSSLTMNDGGSQESKLRVAAHRRLALAFDVGQDLRDGVADLLRCGRGLRRCLLHDLAHQATPWSAR